MTADFRALCAELLADYEEHLYRSVLADRARAALAQPEPEVVEPTDEELDALWFEIDGRQGLGWKSFARAALARWGHQPAPPAAGADCPACEGVPKPGNQPCAVCGRPAPVPAEGEVAELVARLRRASDGASAMGWEQDSWIIARAAVLLEQRHPAPVPVSERLPGPEDCDAEGRVWVSCKPPEQKATIFWELAPADEAMEWAPVDSWLPATALPLPQGEVE